MFVENEDYDNLWICHDCFTDQDLQKYVFSKGVQVPKCNLCEVNNVAIHTKDSGLIRMVRALIRYHYPEYEYNHHWGGTYGPAAFLSSPNLIFRVPKFKNEQERETFEFIIDTTIGGIDSDHEIPLHKKSLSGE